MIPDLKMTCCLYCRIVVAALFLAFSALFASAEEGEWVIRKVALPPGNFPSINNSGEVVCAVYGAGIVSNVRGVLAPSGEMPHLSNSGEVVYADWTGTNWDLFSTTRGQITHGELVDINSSLFDGNASGEIVYAVNDTNNYGQIFSTVRGQVTSNAVNHFNPCINDLGEIVWTEFPPVTPGVDVSSTRGQLPGFSRSMYKLDNADNFCSSGSLPDGPQNYTSPHVLSSVHGFVISDPKQYQWGGCIDDQGTIVWAQGDGIYEADWTVNPTLTIAPTVSGFALEWSTNFLVYSIQYSTNLTSPPNWQPLNSSITTNGNHFHVSIGTNLAAGVWFRLSKPVD